MILNKELISLLWFFAFFISSFAASPFAAADAGPPLLTDDPKTPGANNWEINIALTGEFSQSEQTYETPLADINYGLGDRLQLKLEVPWRIDNSNAGNPKSGFNSAVGGVKWRYWQNEQGNLLVSTYPQQTFHMPAPAAWKAGFSGDASGTLLPIELQWDIAGFSLNEEAGELIANGGKNQLILGSAWSKELVHSFTVLAEIHGQYASDWRDHLLLFNVGTVTDLSKTYTLLFSAGHTIDSSAPAAYSIYFALQLHI